MAPWWSYAPEDLLLFSPQVYWRLFVLENQSLWPLPLLMLGLGALALLQLIRPRPWSGRVLWAGLGAAWVWVGWSFLANRYAAINWMAGYAAAGFIVEGLLLGWAGAIRGCLRPAVRRSWPGFVGLGLLLYAVVMHPLLPLVTERPLAAAEVIGIAPDPTAFATLGLLRLAEPGWWRGWLSILPLLWCAVSWATLQTMGEAQNIAPLAAVLLFLFSVWPSDRRAMGE